MVKWAIFDVDGTLFPRTSLEKKYISYLIRQGILPVKNIFHYALYATTNIFHKNFTDAFKNNKMYLYKLPGKIVWANAAYFVQDVIWPEISKRGLQEIEHYRKEDYKILIMSGSPDFLTMNLTKIVKPDFTITSNLQIKNGHFTGKINGLHPYGERKTKILLNTASRIKIDFDKSVVYANHDSDIDHMNLFGRAIAVNPRPKLKTYALEKGWSIEYW